MSESQIGGLVVLIIPFLLVLLAAILWVVDKVKRVVRKMLKMPEPVTHHSLSFAAERARMKRIAHSHTERPAVPEEMKDSFGALNDSFRSLGFGFEEIRKAQMAMVDAIDRAIISALRDCAMFMATKYELGITEPLVFIRTAPIKRIFVRWKIRRNVRKCCTQCSHYQKDCPIKNILLKGRW